MDTFTESYIESALWSSIDDAGNPLDQSDAQLSDEAITLFKTDCEQFQGEYPKIMGDYTDYTIEHVAHDFWLTRNGHGAGFWDGDYPKALGEALTQLAHNYGECDLYIGDDGKIYAS